MPRRHLRGFFGERPKLICSTRGQATQSGPRASLIHTFALLPCHPALEPNIHTRIQNYRDFLKDSGLRGFPQAFSKGTGEGAVRRLGLTLLVCIIAGFTASCVGLNGSSSTGTDRVAITPSAPSVRANGTQAFTATVAKETNPTVTWTVNDIANGNAMVGTITSTGPLTATYTAPANLRRRSGGKLWNWIQ